jgi:CHASE2 domain-containing sensor protein/two-component sensor histidine kinase
MTMTRPWQLFKKQLGDISSSGVPSTWVTYLPGITVIGLVCLVRALGGLQALEWWAYDTFLRTRPPEPSDQRILIIAIDDDDIQRFDNRLPDQPIADLLAVLDTYQPQVVGVDLIRDLPAEPGYQAWVRALEQFPYVFGIDGLGEAIQPPPTLPAERVGFADFPFDRDGYIRRLWLVAEDPESGEIRQSLALRLVSAYLTADNISVVQDAAALQLGDIQPLPVVAHSGAYARTYVEGYQVLLNPRSGRDTFQQVSLEAVLAGQVAPEMIRDRIVLIGVIAPTVPDLLPSAAIASETPGLVYGVEMHAHAISQLLSTTLDSRPQIRVWPDGLEYLWIVLWGSLGIWLVRRFPKPVRYVVLTGGLSLGLLGGSYVALWLWGWWLPIVPPLLVFGINGLVLSGFYLYDQAMRGRIEERQQVIEHTFNIVHNGPLQDLADIRRIAASEPNLQSISSKLEGLDQAIRSLYVRLEQSAQAEQQQPTLLLGDLSLSLDQPLERNLYEVYAQTVRRELPGFQSLKVKLIKFDPLQTEGLSPRDHRDICRFLEESLCNVGKHATQPTHLKVVCQSIDQQNLIRVEDNGQLTESSMPRSLSPPQGKQRTCGWGTNQATKLARRLNGSFQRGPLSPRGTYCELRWPVCCYKTKFIE